MTVRSVIARAPARVAAITMMAACVPGWAAAQWERPPESGGRIVSLGQPPRLRWHAGLAAGAALSPKQTQSLSAQAHFGVSRDLLNPLSIHVHVAGIVVIPELQYHFIGEPSLPYPVRTDGLSAALRVVMPIEVGRIRY